MSTPTDEAGSSRAGSGSAVTGEQFTQLLEVMTNKLDDKFDKLRTDLADTQAKTQERLVKRVKREPTPAFRKKGNEKQHTFNDTVREHLQEATDALGDESESEPLAVKKARDSLQKGIEAMQHRQKLIRMADRSDQGWAAAEEYETYELAQNSDDEKKIYRAEMCAERKAKQAKKVRPARRGPTHAYSPATAPVGRPYGGPQLAANMPQWAHWQPTLPSLKPIVCYGCGREGHIRRNCAYGRTAQGNHGKESILSLRWPRVIILNRSISFPFHFHFISISVPFHFHFRSVPFHFHFRSISFPHLALACCVIVREDVFSACHCLAAFAAFNVCSAIMG